MNNTGTRAPSKRAGRSFTAAQTLLERGQADGALEVFEALLLPPPGVDTNAPPADVSSSDDVWRIHLGIARALEHEGRLKEAMTACKHAQKHASHSEPGPWLTEGSLHAALGARMTALECFRKAAARAPEDLTARHLITTMGGRDFSAPLQAEVVELFDRYADRFDQHLVTELGYNGHAAVPNLLHRLASHQAGSWDVLDLGCGTGLCGEGLRPMAATLVGVDVAPRMVEKTRARGTYDDAFAADLVYALACRSDASVDVLASADVLGYIGDLSALFQQAARVLRAGGYLAFSVEAAADDDATYQMGPARRCRYGRNYLLSLAERYGFTEEALEAATLRTEAGADVVEFVAVLQLHNN